MLQPVWIHRRLRNWSDVYRWGESAGVRKMMPPEQLHFTQMTVREPVEWGDLELSGEDLVIPSGPKPIQIFAWSIKGLIFEDPAVLMRHQALLKRFPMMDHPRMRPHVSLYKGGRMPTTVYEGELVFGPEEAEAFDATNTQGIKHVRIADLL